MSNRLTGSGIVWCFHVVSDERSAPTNLSASPASQRRVLLEILYFHHTIFIFQFQFIWLTFLTDFPIGMVYIPGKEYNQLYKNCAFSKYDFPYFEFSAEIWLTDSLQESWAGPPANTKVIMSSNVRLIWNSVNTKPDITEGSSPQKWWKCRLTEVDRAGISVVTT